MIDGFICNQASYEMVAKDASVFQRYTWETVIVDEGACSSLQLTDMAFSNAHVYAKVKE